MHEILAGGCQCGEIRYEVDPQEILTLYCCHCMDCQRQAASAHGMSMLVNPAGFRVTQGELKIWQCRVDQGYFKQHHHCGTCGVRILHTRDADGPDDALSLKAGSLDATDHLHPVGHIWTKRKQPWVIFHPDALVYDWTPDDDFRALTDAYRARRKDRNGA